LRNCVLSLSVGKSGPVPSFFIDGLLNFGLWSWIGPDCSVTLGVHLFNVFGVNTSGDEFGEVFFVSFFIFFFKLVHVFADVSTENMFLVSFSVELTFVESGESLWRVRNIQTGISSSLQNSEDSGSS